jgi:hypothetical protein
MFEAKRRNSAPNPELLCYLVVAQLVAHARTGEWLRTDHLAESARLWTDATGAPAGWLERIELGQMSAAVAAEFLPPYGFVDADLLMSLFKDGWRVNLPSPVVRRIYNACVAKLHAQ